MVALMKENQSEYFDVDSNRFSTALTVSARKEGEEDDEPDEEDEDMTPFYMDEPFFTVSAPNESSTFQLSNFIGSNEQLSTKGILTLMSHCNSIRELSLSYSYLSDEFLKALSSDDTLNLETLRVEAHPESKPLTKISNETWLAFANRFPSINFVLLTYLTEAEDYEALLSPQVPLTHLYFDECAPTAAIARVGANCPRLVELVVGAYGPSTIDEALIAAAHGCPRLKSVGLGDCELSCSGFVEFVSLCRERLQVIYVLDTSLLEDTKYNVAQVSSKVSSLLGKTWQPHYVPYW